IVGNLMQIGFFFRPRFRPEAVNPANGWCRIFCTRSLTRTAMNLAKVIAVTWVAYMVVRNWAEPIVSLQQLSLARLIPAAGEAVYSVCVRVCLILLVLGVIDYAYQRWQHERDLRM